MRFYERTKQFESYFLKVGIKDFLPLFDGTLKIGYRQEKVLNYYGQPFPIKAYRNQTPEGTEYLVIEYPPRTQNQVYSTEWIMLKKQACNYGGYRYYFYCPFCGRKTTYLYYSIKHRYFACRHCENLAYKVENETRFDRLVRKKFKLKSKLYDGDLRPKGMHWGTFERITDKLSFIENDLMDEAIAKIF